MCVTKQPNETYTHFIERIKKNSLATKVKLNDLRDNMDITRLTFITEEDTQRLNKYDNILELSYKDINLGKYRKLVKGFFQNKKPP